MIRTKRLYLPCTIFLFVLSVSTFNLKAQNIQQSNAINLFESNLDAFEARVWDARTIWEQTAAELKSTANPSTLYNQLSQLRNKYNGMSSFIFQLRYYANALNNTTLIRGVSELHSQQISGQNATIIALDALSSGTLITQHLIPIEASLLEMLRVTNDCLRREIQVIRRNNRQ